MWLCADYFHSSNIYNERVCLMYSLKELFKLQFSPSLLLGIKETKGDLHLRICSMKCLLNKTSSNHPLEQAPARNGGPFYKACTRLHLTHGENANMIPSARVTKPWPEKTQKHTAALRFAAKQHCPAPTPTAIKNKMKWKLLTVGKEDVLRMERSCEPAL